MALYFDAYACNIGRMSDEIPQHSLVWKAISRVHATGRARIDAALKQNDLPSLDIFEALTALANGTSTAKALEADLGLPQYAVSRLLDRMEAKGLISRVANQADQRSKVICVTDLGHNVLRGQAMTYKTALAEFMGARAKPGQLERMITLLALLDGDSETN